jgi:sugar phosphate isomerase/epimerase
VSGPRLGVQLYTLRHAGAPLEQLLAEVAAAGYQGVETVGTQGADPVRLRDALGAAGLTLASAHVPLAELRADPARMASTYRAAGSPMLVVPFLAPPDRPHDLAGWAALGRELDDLGERLADAGLALAYHHHDFELARHDGRDGLTAMLDAADAQRLALELDSGWLAAVGEDPTAWIDRWGERVARVHLKDLLPGAGPPTWADVGDGVLDLPGVVASARAQRVPWLLVEHDAPADPLATMRRSATAARLALGLD